VRPKDAQRGGRPAGDGPGSRRGPSARLGAWPWPGLWAAALLGACLACEARPQAVSEHIPVLVWSKEEVARFRINAEAETQWARGEQRLRAPLAMPAAFETRLSREEREIWRVAIDAMERRQALNDEAILMLTAPRAVHEPCEVRARPETLRLSERIAVQHLLQQQRNILWRLGRNELAARHVLTALTEMQEPFAADRLRHAEGAVLVPLREIKSELAALDTVQTRPDGDWEPGRLLPRLARHRPALLLLARAETALADWETRSAASPRWSYVAPATQPARAAIAIWRKEQVALRDAFTAYVAQSKALERSLGSGGEDPTRQCLAQQSKEIRFLSGLYEAVLRMQYEAAEADQLRQVVWHQAELRQIVSEVIADLGRDTADLMDMEVALLRRWDRVSATFWQALPNFLHAETSPTSPVVGDAEAWRTQFFALREQANLRGGRAEAEPEQPPDRRGRARPPFVAAIFELVRSPSRVAEVEQGLLAISELESHLAGMRDAVMRVCRDDACMNFPEVRVPHSPRTSSWVDLWRQTPVAERTLGHSLLVLELCQLHLARQVQRMSRIYAWFSELSNADMRWQRLTAWERTWLLYTARNGTYLPYLRAIATLEEESRALTQPRENRRVSPRLQSLLTYQVQLFDLTLDYARFIDRGGEAPIPLETLLAAWQRLHDAFSAIEAATQLRDEKLEAAKESHP